MTTGTAPHLSNVQKGEITRAQILATAIPLLARHGGRGISLGDIAKAAGVSKTGLLHHFPSKVALLNAALDVRDEEDAPTLVGAASVAQVLAAFVERVQRWQDKPELIGLFTVQVTENLNQDDPIHGRLLERARDLRERLVGDLEAGVRSGEIRPDVNPALKAAEIIAFISGLESYWLLDPDLPVVEICENWRRDQLATMLP